MAQPAPAPMIQPNATVTINRQTASPASVAIQVGQVVEIHNEDNADYQLPVSYVNGNASDNYPLAIYLPAGGKLYFIGEAVSTCKYNVDAYTGSLSKPERSLGSGPYTIGVNSGTTGGGEK